MYIIINNNTLKVTNLFIHPTDGRLDAIADATTF